MDDCIPQSKPDITKIYQDLQALKTQNLRSLLSKKKGNGFQWLAPTQDFKLPAKIQLIGERVKVWLEKTLSHGLSSQKFKATLVITNFRLIVALPDNSPLQDYLTVPLGYIQSIDEAKDSKTHELFVNIETKDMRCIKIHGQD